MVTCQTELQKQFEVYTPFDHASRQLEMQGNDINKGARHFACSNRSNQGTATGHTPFCSFEITLQLLFQPQFCKPLNIPL